MRGCAGGVKRRVAEPYEQSRPPIVAYFHFSFNSEYFTMKILVLMVFLCVLFAPGLFFNHVFCVDDNNLQALDLGVDMSQKKSDIHIPR
ncbi:hypothetical protein TW78_09440 [Vibrio coralliilyticus]|uniref:Uncharacterized protein n=1 Tax=Vibrio coralliilyticus TaxID=190893 RepID=A0A837G8B5_9VIBR|nr:hypothetical protein [Vibrio coralliilyticus]KJY73400.1 hypothetical protein TW78_09440 [Vibrio coralliilyticus]QOU33190.1 hypothetical protein TW71_024730 [Vibrio coralliilyticus]